MRIRNVLHACYACLYEHICLIYVIYSVLQRPFRGGKLLFNVCSTSLYDKKENSREKVISAHALTQSAYLRTSAVYLGTQASQEVLLMGRLYYRGGVKRYPGACFNNIYII